MRKLWLARIALIATLAAVYVYGFELRRQEIPHWLASGYTIHGEMMLPTNDAYYELLMADGGRTRGESSLLADMVALGRKATGWPAGNVGFLLPLFFAPLAALPPMWLLWRYGYHAGALAAGVFIASSPAYLSRTRAGYLDGDLLTLFFPLLLATGLALWLGAADREADGRDDRAWAVNNSAWLAGAFGLGLLAWLYKAFYPSGEILAAAIIAAGGVALIFTQRRRLAVGLPGLGLLALAAWKPAPGLALLLFLAAILRLPAARRLAAKPAPVISGCLLPGGILLAPWARQLAARAESFITRYAAQDPPMGEEAVHEGLNVANTYATISEAQAVPPEFFSTAIVPVHLIFLLSVAGIFIMLKRRPQMFVFLPLIGLGFAAVELGMRFGMYGTALGLSCGMAVSLFQRGDAGPAWNDLSEDGRKRRIAGHALSWGLSLIVCFAVMHATIPNLRTLRPTSFFSPQFGLALKELDRRLPPGCMLWLWWDYGFTAQYLARRDSVADSHRNNFTDVFLPALAMSTDSPMQGSRIMRFVGGKAVPVKRVAGTRQVVYECGGAMNLLNDLGHAQATALLESLKSAPAASPPGAPEQYMVASWEGLQHLYHMSAIGKWDLRRGGSPKYLLLTLDKSAGVDLDQGRITVADQPPLKLGGASVFEADGTVTNMDFDQESSMFALWIRQTGEGYLLHKELYNSVFVRLLRWNKSDAPMPGFELAHDKGRLLRVFKSVEN